MPLPMLIFVTPEGRVTGPVPAAEKDHYLEKGFRIWTGRKETNMTAKSDLDRCVATTGAGTRCKMTALADSPFCHLHHNPKARKD